MLLPIVLLLASAGSIQQADNVAAASMEKSGTSSQPRTLLSDPGSNNFVIERRGEQMLDEGIIIPKNPRRTNNNCMSITAYVFSDGENPELQYVTHCPNLDVPNQTERARHRLPETEQQPDLKRTKY